MRNIGQLSSQSLAAQFSDYLYVKGIENQIESHRDGSWSIWVFEEDRIEEASGLLRAFEQNPNAPEVQAAAGEAGERRRLEQAVAQQDVLTRETLWPGGRGHRPSATLVYIAISLFCGAITLLGANTQWATALLISNYEATAGHPWWMGLVEIGHGQVWRLVTPIFLHFGLLHLLFNMLWLKDLGSMVERVKGTVFFVSLTLAIAVASNVMQYAVSGPRFGGMSGVVYGLLGYVWMQGRFNPASGMRLHPSTVSMMIAWFVLGVLGLLGPVANTVHGAGLALGMIWGYLSARGGRRAGRPGWGRGGP